MNKTNSADRSLGLTTVMNDGPEFTTDEGDTIAVNEVAPNLFEADIDAADGGCSLPLTRTDIEDLIDYLKGVIA